MSTFDTPFPESIERNGASDMIASMDAENGLIGGLLLDNSSFDRISDRLKAEHFSTSYSRQIFAEISRQIGAGQACDVVTVGMALDGHVTMKQLNQMAQFVPSAANTRRYADMVIRRCHRSDRRAGCRFLAICYVASCAYFIRAAA